MRCALVLLAACGGNTAVTQLDAPTTDAYVGCTATLTGNVEDAIASPSVCPTVGPGTGTSEGHAVIDFTIPSMALGTSLAVGVDLGTVAMPGSFTPETTAVWSSFAIQMRAMAGACIFNAGNLADPEGNFSLALDSVSPPHGSLTVTMFVLPYADELGNQSDCGSVATESLQLAF